MFKHILVAVDFGDSSKEALEVAIALSKKYESALTLIHTWEIPVYAYGDLDLNVIDILGPLRDVAKRQLESLLAEVRKERPEARSVLPIGVPWHEILEAIDHLSPDLVVMGTHGRQGVRHLLLGSVAEKVIRLSRVPVITVRAKHWVPPPLLSSE